MQELIDEELQFICDTLLCNSLAFMVAEEDAGLPMPLFYQRKSKRKG